MKKVFLLIAITASNLFISCGPSTAEQQVHEEKREQAEQELDNSFEEDMFDELSSEDSTVTE